jgi:hypothetical protein
MTTSTSTSAASIAATPIPDHEVTCNIVKHGERLDRFKKKKEKPSGINYPRI